MYIKAVLEGGVIDVFSELTSCCCKFSDRSGMVLRCGEDENPSGIISERTGEIYQVDGWPTFLGGFEPAGTVKIDWIEEAEYKELLLALDETGTVPDPDDATEESPEQNAPKILSRQALTEQVELLTQQNAMLLECLLEMSEAVYV